MKRKRSKTFRLLQHKVSKKKFFALADRYADSNDKDVRNLSLALLTHIEKFFTFLRNEGVEPTNNSAERALRCAVQWRRTGFGSAGRNRRGAHAYRDPDVPPSESTATRLPRQRHPVTPQRSGSAFTAPSRSNHLNCYLKTLVAFG